MKNICDTSPNSRLGTQRPSKVYQGCTLVKAGQRCSLFLANDSEAGKRPKPEVHIGTTGVGMSSSIMSKSGGNVNNRMAVENSATNSGQWYSVHGQPTPLVLLKPKANIALADQGSPTATSTMVLPRYHHSIIGGTCQVPLWGESLGSLQQLPRTESVGDSRSNYKGESVTVSPYLTDLQQHSQAPGQSHPPPLLTSNSKNGSSASWVSTGPSVLQTLQTPVDLPLKRALPNLIRCSQQSSHMLETQLPSLRPSFLSPKLTWLGSQQSAESR